MNPNYKVSSLVDIEKNTRWIYSKFLKDTVISSRVRIARNIKGYPFPHNMDFEDCVEIEKKLMNVFFSFPAKKIFIVNISSLSENEKKFLVERHLISREFSENGLSSKVIIIPEKKLTVMINEEDHLRIQAILPGFNIKKCWQIIDKVDDFIEGEIEYAFSPKFGYLTACPTNIGTGLRSSVLIHIPGIVFLKKTRQLFKIIKNWGIIIRGFYGEGSNSFGSVYQISSYETTGKSEKEIINEFENVVKLLKEEEKRSIEEIKMDKKLREKIYKNLQKFYEEDQITLNRFSSLFSLISILFKIGTIEINTEILKRIFFHFLPGHRNFYQHYLYRKNNGKIIKKEIMGVIK